MIIQPECSRRLHQPALQLWQNCSTSPSDLVNYWMKWKSRASHLFSNQTTIQTLQATAQYHCDPFWVNLLTDIFETSYLPTLKNTIQPLHSSGGLLMESLPLEVYWIPSTSCLEQEHDICLYSSTTVKHYGVHKQILRWFAHYPCSHTQYVCANGLSSDISIARWMWRLAICVCKAGGKAESHPGRWVSSHSCLAKVL